jgi:hypothetical protein
MTTQLARLVPTLTLPALVASAETHAQRRFLEFFAGSLHESEVYVR